LDTDGDKVRINCQDDFSILLEELSGSKAVKIFVREDLNKSALVLTKKNSIEILSENEVEQVQVQEKEASETDSAEEKPFDQNHSDVPKWYKQSDSNESNSDSDSQNENAESLKLEKWEFWLDAYTQKDNPIQILWKLKACVQQKIKSIRRHMRKTNPKALKAMNFKQIKHDCRKLVIEAKKNDTATEVNFDDIKALLLSLEDSEDLKSWIVFKVTIQQKINSTRTLIKSIPELRKKFHAFHKERKEHKKGRHHGKFAFWKKFKHGC